MKPTPLAVILCILLPFSAYAAERREMHVPTSDGIQLATDVYLPAAEGAFPVILIRTPYDKNGKRPWAEKFAASGYAVVIQDVRGKFASNGTFVPFLNEEKDGLETLDWIATQSWSDGRVGAFGLSYLGHAGLLLARHGHPTLKTVFSSSGWIESERLNESGGAFHMMLAIPWLLFAEGQTQRSLRDFDLEELFRFLPVGDVFESVGMDVPGWKDSRVMRANQRADYSKMSIPIFHLTGWYDFVAPASLHTWRAARQVSDRPQRLMIGPWVHDQIQTSVTSVGDLDPGPESVLGSERLLQLAIGWFDCHLRERCTDESPVRIFFLGENRWRDFDVWPPRGSRKQTLFLESNGKAASSPDDGRLAAAPPRRRGSDRFLFDPADPVPTRGGANFHFFPEVAGPREQAEVESRNDVVVYTTPPLASDFVIAGPMRAVLHVATQARDTDFTAKLTSLDGEGRSISIADGIVRMSRRNGGEQRELVDPERVYEVSIDMGEIAMRIPAGHRLRLQVSSSNFPKFDRNPNTGEDPFEAKELKRVMQTIHHSTAYPSRIELTVLDTTLSFRSPEAPQERSAAKIPEPTAQSSSPATDPTALIESGKAALNASRLEEAITAFESAVALEPTRSDSHYWAGRAYIEKLQSAGMAEKMTLAGKTRRALEKAIELDPKNVDARATLARYYLGAPAIAGGSTKKAKEQVDAVAALDPVKGNVLMGQIHAEKKEWSEAVTAYTRALEHDRSNAAIHFELGRAFQELQRWQEAVTSFEAALAANP
jgi:uncharacterized protein